jgi:uncharacterized protein YggE
MKKHLLTLTFLAFLIPAFSQTDKNPYPRTITVNGSAEMEVIPDEIYVVVDLKEYEKKGQGKIDLETIKSQFLKSVKEVGIPDSNITIAAYEGFNNPWLKKKKKTELYSSIAYQIKFSKSSDMDRLVEKLDDDATQNFRIVKTSHSKLAQFRKQLKIDAIRAAREKASYLSEAIGEKIGEAVTITEPSENIIYPIYARYSNVAGQAESADQGAAVDFNKIKFRFDISVVFALK